MIDPSPSVPADHSHFWWDRRVVYYSTLMLISGAVGMWDAPLGRVVPACIILMSLFFMSRTPWVRIRGDTLTTGTPLHRRNLMRQNMSDVVVLANPRRPGEFSIAVVEADGSREVLYGLTPGRWWPKRSQSDMQPSAELLRAWLRASTS